MDMKKNVNIGKTYTNDKGAGEFTKAIAQVERDNSFDDISASKFTAVLVDGSSDVSVVENEIVYVCTCRNGNSKVNVHTFCTGVKRSGNKYYVSSATKYWK